MTKDDMKALGAAILILGWAVPSKAQTVDWGSDPVQQVSTQLKSAAPIAFAQNAPQAEAAEPARIHVEFQCTPERNKPTDVIDAIQIGRDSYRQYDGGYVPLSPVHAQGYEFSIVGNTLSIRRLDGSAPSIVIGYVGTKKPCAWSGSAWGEYAESPVIEASLLDLSKEIGPVTACSSRVIDSRLEYSKSAELTLTLTDVEFGRKAVLKSKIGTVGFFSKEECERAELKD